MTMKSKLAKGAAACAVTVGVLGAGAGVAAADPGQDYQPNNPIPQQQDNNWQQQDHRDGDQNNNDWDQHNGGDRHDDRNQDAPQQQHGFWFFGTWIPLP